MAVNRFYRPVKQQYISQFVPENLQLMQGALQATQKRADENEQFLENTYDELLKQEALPEFDTDQLNQIKQEYKDFSSEMMGKEMSSAEARRDIKRFIADKQADPRMKKIMQGVAAKKKYDELTEKYGSDSDAWAKAPEMEYKFLKNYNEYLKQDKKNGKFAIDYIGGHENIIRGVNVRDLEEELFNNLKASGYEGVAETALGTYYKHGQKGISQDMITKLGKAGYDNFRWGPGGRQLSERYDMMVDQGQVPTIETEKGTEILDKENFILYNVLSTGKEFQYMQYTSDKAAALNADQKKLEETKRIAGSLGNTTLSLLGVTGAQSEDRGFGETVSASVAVTNSFFNSIGDIAGEIFKDMNGESSIFSNTDMSPAEVIGNVITKNASEALGTQISPEQTDKYRTSALNWKNKLTKEQIDEYRKIKDKEKLKQKLKEDFEKERKDIEKKTYEFIGEIDLYKNNQTQQADQVKFSDVAGAPVTLLINDGGVSLPPNLDFNALADEGWEIKGHSKIKDSNPVAPGERLGVVLENASGERITVSTKGALAKTSGVADMVVSEGESYVADIVSNSLLNVERANYTIPLDPAEWSQTYDPNQQLTRMDYVTNKEYTPGGPYLKLNTSDKGYSIEHAYGENKVSLLFGTTGKLDANNAKAKRMYKETREGIKDIYNNPNLNADQRNTQVWMFLKLIEEKLK